MAVSFTDDAIFSGVVQEEAKKPQHVQIFRKKEKEEVRRERLGEGEEGEGRKLSPTATGREDSFLMKTPQIDIRR